MCIVWIRDLGLMRRVETSVEQESGGCVIDVVEKRIKLGRNFEVHVRLAIFVVGLLR